jgi:hypothetical protein
MECSYNCSMPCYTYRISIGDEMQEKLNITLDEEREADATEWVDATVRFL